MQHTLERFAEKYAKNGKVPILFNFKAFSRYLLNNKTKLINDAHYIHYYPGRIFPYIPLYLLAINDFKKLDGIVLDPFAGSGTILLEAITNPIIKRIAFGVEINPIGRLISKVKTTPLNVRKIEYYFSAISSSYKNNAIGREEEIPHFKNRDLWFSESAIKRLTKLKFAISTLKADSDYKDFFLVMFFKYYSQGF